MWSHFDSRYLQSSTKICRACNQVIQSTSPFVPLLLYLLLLPLQEGWREEGRESLATDGRHTAAQSPTTRGAWEAERRGSSQPRKRSLSGQTGPPGLLRVPSSPSQWVNLLSCLRLPLSVPVASFSLFVRTDSASRNGEFSQLWWFLGVACEKKLWWIHYWNYGEFCSWQDLQ